MFSTIFCYATKISDLSLKEVPIIEMPNVFNSNLLEEEMSLRAPGRAPQFAHNFEVDINILDKMVWQTEGENIVGRVIISSKKAKSINLGFSKYLLPNKVNLFIYNVDKSHIRGPFTIADNEEHSQLWTPIVYGDKIVIELSFPADGSRGNEILGLELSSVNHDYIGFGQMISGSCNLDVICDATNGWDIVDGYRDIIQSVAVISTGGNTFCTGFLIDNVAQDCKPFFMTADHCGINQGSAASLVTYWNFENSFCREPNTNQSGQNGDGNLNDFNTGSIFRAGYGPSDFALVELDDPVSETANGFFAGFDATGNIPTSAIGIHHPATDEKRISFDMDALAFTDYGGDANAANKNHVHVNDWDIGTTEGGSSGSPLFDQDKRVVGQLHGGGAACGNDLSDWYGAIVHSWNGGGTPQTQLKYWLDPDNTGVLITDGRYAEQCNFQINTPSQNFALCNENNLEFEVMANELFSTDVTLEASGLPNTVSVDFSNMTIPANGTSTVTLSGLTNLTSGVYTLIISGSNSNGESTLLNININISEGTISTISGLIPEDNATAVNTESDLSWSPIIGAQNYDLEVSTDANFDAIIANAFGINESEFALENLNIETRYYWRVRANNICGQGNWVTHSFETGVIDCNSKLYQGTAVIIDENGQNTVYSTINISDSGVISDLNIINISGTHTFVGDLIFTLISPEGTEVVLFDQICWNNNNFNIGFDDSGLSGDLPCPPVDGQLYMPEQNLTAFNGENITGEWQLKIEDTFNNDGGQLNSWELGYCLISSPVAVYEINTTTVGFEKCVNVEDSFDITLSNGFEGEVTLVSSGLNNVSFSSNPAFAGQTVTVTLGVDLDALLGSELMISADDGTNQANIIIPVLSDPLPECVDIFIYDLDTRLPYIDWAEGQYTDFYYLNLYKEGNLINTWLSNEERFAQVTDILDYETNYRLELVQSNFCGQSVCDELIFQTKSFGGTFNIGNNPFKLYPIPTSDFVTLEFAKSVSFMEWSLHDVVGKFITEGTISDASSTQLDLSSLAAGVYLFKLSTQNYDEVIKVVKQ